MATNDARPVVAALATHVIGVCCHSKDQLTARLLKQPTFLEHLFQQLTTSSPGRAAAAASVLKELAFENASLSQDLLNRGMLKHLRQLLRSTCPRDRALGAGVIANVSRGISLRHATLELKHASKRAIRTLTQIIQTQTDDSELLRLCTATLTYLVHHTEEYQQEALEAIPSLTSHCVSPPSPSPPPPPSPRRKPKQHEDDIRRLALLALAEICSRIEIARKKVVDSQLLPMLTKILVHPSASMRRAALLAIRSLSRSVKLGTPFGTSNHVHQALARAGVAELIVPLLEDPSLEVFSAFPFPLPSLIMIISPPPSCHHPRLGKRDLSMCACPAR